MEQLPHELLLRVFAYFEHNGLLCLRMVCRTWASLAASRIRVLQGRSDLFSERLSATFCGLESLSLGCDLDSNERVLCAFGQRSSQIKRLRIDVIGLRAEFAPLLPNLQSLILDGAERREEVARFLSSLKGLRHLQLSHHAMLLADVVSPIVHLSLPPEVEAFSLIVQKFALSLERLAFVDLVGHVMAELPHLFSQLPKLRHLTMHGWHWTLLESSMRSLKVVEGTTACKFGSQLAASCPYIHSLEQVLSVESLVLMQEFGSRFSVLHVPDGTTLGLLVDHLLVCPNVNELFIQGVIEFTGNSQLCSFPQVRVLRCFAAQRGAVLQITGMFLNIRRLVAYAGLWTLADFEHLSWSLPKLEDLMIGVMDAIVICQVLTQRDIFPQLLRLRMIIHEGIVLVRQTARLHRPWLQLRVDP